MPHSDGSQLSFVAHGPLVANCFNVKLTVSSQYTHVYYTRHLQMDSVVHHLFHLHLEVAMATTEIMHIASVLFPGKCKRGIAYAQIIRGSLVMCRTTQAGCVL